jgi:hypothetical protein
MQRTGNTFHVLRDGEEPGRKINVTQKLRLVVILVLFGWADKPVEKHCWLICCERKILFRLKKQAEKDGL